MLKDRYLHGVDLRDDSGKKMSNSTIADKIDQAAAHIEHYLDLYIRPVVFSADDGTQEKHDYRNSDFYSWSYIKLYQYPVISVESVKLLFPSNSELIDYPPEWFKVTKDSGILEMVPDASTIPLSYLSNGVYLPEFILAKQMVPQVLEVEYTAGFEESKIPMDLNDLIGLRAAIDVMEIMGDLIIGAGIANQSIGIDGMSQSVGTTASAMYGGYSARQEAYGKKLEAGLKKAKDYYKGITFTSI
jgi:hypothetical protein